MQLFETKVKTERLQSNGTNKKVTEIYLVDAMSVTEAEAKTLENVVSGSDIQIISAKETNYKEIIKNDLAEHYYSAKVNFITIDEKSGAEKKTPALSVICANSFDEAYKTIKEVMNGSMMDWQLAELKETAIIEFIG